MEEFEKNENTINWSCSIYWDLFNKSLKNDKFRTIVLDKFLVSSNQNIVKDVLKVPLINSEIGDK